MTEQQSDKLQFNIKSTAYLFSRLDTDNLDEDKLYDVAVWCYTLWRELDKAGIKV